MNYIDELYDLVIVIILEKIFSGFNQKFLVAKPLRIPTKF